MPDGAGATVAVVDDDAPTELLLIRHARPQRAAADQGVTDPALTELGTRQAELMAEALAEHPISVIYSSPLRRAVDTARPLADRLRLPITTRDDLAEFDFGHDGAPTAAGAVEPRWRAWARRLATQRDDPDLAAFRLRVAAAMTAIAREHPSASVAVVCHTGVINAYVAAVRGTEDTFVHRLGHTSVSRVLVPRLGTPVVRTVNEADHLPPRRDHAGAGTGPPDQGAEDTGAAGAGANSP
ncbi:putative phosphoglycerate mutase [Actinoalloteichus cyanogriseus DSM 43889]|uniref:Phosphoglycerate mutase n=1 Tax=Actinoalloteichus caeruleus DSM 43889 TaxID=1120930 RepID=A0ABT1JCV6_ACTCY|nr:putative phosphoglycerate mutase [Actinoalloteichus caeruleus DSM 43889]